MKSIHLLIMSVVATLGVSNAALAVPAPIFFSGNAPGYCDTLPAIPSVMDELGPPGTFPANESIAISVTTTTLSSCAVGIGDIAQVPNYLVSITNLTGIPFTDLYFVTDSTGLIVTNVDGVINNGIAFAIDNVGLNQPLVAEIGGTSALVFEPGETWHFVVQDMVNTGTGAFVTPSITSIGVGGSADPMSNASIIAIPVPEPGAMCILVASFGVAQRGRARRDWA